MAGYCDVYWLAMPHELQTTGTQADARFVFQTPKPSDNYGSSYLE